MEINLAFVLNKLRCLREVHIPYAVSTNMPFVTCDEETFNDQIWMFSTLDELSTFVKKYEPQKIMFKGITVKQESMKAFYMDMHAMGINEVVFCDERMEYKLEMGKLVQIPDFSSIPAHKRPLLNPSLQLSTIYFFQEVRRQVELQNTERLEMLAEEMYVNLAKARFLMPVLATSGDDKKGNISMPYITTKEGQKFQPIFADHTQYMRHVKKNKPSENTKLLIVGISELLKYHMPDCQGYMLDPDGYCHPLNQLQLTFIKERFLETAK